MRASTCLHVTTELNCSKDNRYFSNDAKQFRKHGIIYKTSVLSRENFEKIKKELDNMPLNIVKETTNSVAHGRRGAHIPSSSVITSILSDSCGEISNLINDITERDVTWNISPVVPIELRIYDERGAGMEWHQDDVLYSPTPQIEVILTISNTSDCTTKWRESGELKKEIETEPNSAIILKAGSDGPEHSVSSLRNGSRVILKFVYAEDGSVFLDDAKTNTMQFTSKKNKKKRVK